MRARLKIVAIIGFVLGFLSLSVKSQTNSSIRIYDSQQIITRNGQYENYINSLYKEDLIGQLYLPDRKALADVRLSLTNDELNNPIAVGAVVSDRYIVFPIQTVSFLDDLAALAGWLSERECSFEPAARYAGMLVSKQPPNKGDLYPNPREAFGLTDSVWDDPFIKKASNQVFKTSVFFILAHELGHIRNDDKPYDTISADEAQQQELSADQFAIEAMRHIGVPPVGMFNFFTVLSMMEGSVPITHPLSGERLLQIAKALEETPGDFVPPNESKTQWAPIIREQSQKFISLIPVIDNKALRTKLRQQAESTKWDDLPQSCAR